MKIETLSIADVDLIVETERDNFPDGWNHDMLVSAFESGRFNALALFEDGVLKGVITYSTAIDTADIEGVVTVKRYRRQGVATRLLSEALSRLASEGISKVLLEVRVSNVSAFALYEGQGFFRVGLRKKYYPDGENAVIMAKELNHNQ